MNLLFQAFNGGKRYMTSALKRAQLRFRRLFCSTAWQRESTRCAAWKVSDAHGHGNAEMQARRQIFAPSFGSFQHNLGDFEFKFALAPSELANQGSFVLVRAQSYGILLWTLEFSSSE